ncbi:MAG: ABC-F family ATP-binding cassette domain-containing protein [Chloroflexi bacterium]|nr:ABC-F family ATP-binding cassette domain-containing protein [Chloroflexota bacterium]
MSILTAINLGKSFGPDDIFAGVTVEIPHNARIALVGPNGAGKTTLIHLLLGIDSPTEGTIHRSKGLTMGFLPQKPDLDGSQTIWDEMMTAFEHLHTLEARLQDLEHALADPARANEQDELLEQYGNLQRRFEDSGGYYIEHETKRVLHGLGFEPDDYDMPLSQLSGGQTTRALLARLLLEKPELLILDEPTNHLDINAVEWLESYLKSFPGAVLMVSHDRYFMDNTVNVIWELNFGEIELYRGNYSHYVQQRDERHERRLKEFEAQQEFIKKEQDYIKKNIAGQNTRQAQGRRKRLERLMSGTDRHGRAIDNPWLLDRPEDTSNFHINLKASRAANQVFKTKGMLIGYDEPLVEVPEILLLRGEVAAVIGPNGIGKSTFLKTILGKMPPLDGEFEWGSRVKLGYFMQAHEDLEADKTLIDEIFKVKFLQDSEVRNYLARYMFQGDDVFRKVETLSGGERGRLALAKLALTGANVLLLDEPTNHLDIPAQEMLEGVLQDYEGTILLVSHDRYLIDALASQIWSLQPGEMEVFEGSYQQFLAVREARRQVEIGNRQADNEDEQNSGDGERTSRKDGLTPYQRQKMLDTLEADIHRLEAELETVTSEITTASEAGDVAKVAELGSRYTDLQSLLNEKMEAWAELA